MLYLYQQKPTHHYTLQRLQSYADCCLLGTCFSRGSWVRKLLVNEQ